jgi:hypothetical protein
MLRRNPRWTLARKYLAGDENPTCLIFMKLESNRDKVEIE